MNRQLKKNLNLVASAYISRGGWGNHHDIPSVMLYATAADASRNDVHLCDAAGDHFERVLLQAGVDSEVAREAGLRVARVIDDIDGFLRHENRGQQYLEHRATLPLHPATDPANDPMWKKRSRKMVFHRGGIRIEAWTPASTKQLSEYGVRHPDLPPDGSAIPLLHRTGGPALVIYNDDGSTFEELWVRRGEVHRERQDGPAWTFTGVYRRWYENGSLIVEVPDVDTSAEGG